ncbi:repeat-containing protein [Candidatus Magnetomorum sp. HK-1]|nr:repeat-containing protein [Candidatus Magnetomorum sp. HK-1]
MTGVKRMNSPHWNECLIVNSRNKNEIFFYYYLFILCIVLLKNIYAGDVIDCDPHKYKHLSQKFVKIAIFSPDSKYVLSGHRDHTVKLWCISNGKLMKVFEHGELDWNLRLAFSPDMTMIASSGYRCDDKITKIWDIKSGKLKKIFHTYSEVLIFRPSGRHIVTASDSCLNLWNIESGNLEKKFIADQLNTFDKLWNISIGSIADQMFKKHTDRVRDIVFTSDEKYIACAVGNKIKLFNFNNPDEFFFLDGHDEIILHLKLSDDAKYLLSSSDSRLNSSLPKISSLKLWDIPNKKLIREYYIEKKYFSLIQSLMFNHDGKKIIAGLWNHMIIIFDIHSASILNIINLKARPHDFSSDGKFFISIGKKLELWDSFTGKHVKTIWSDN